MNWILTCLEVFVFYYWNFNKQFALMIVKYKINVLSNTYKLQIMEKVLKLVRIERVITQFYNRYNMSFWTNKKNNRKKYVKDTFSIYKSLGFFFEWVVVPRENTAWYLNVIRCCKMSELRWAGNNWNGSLLYVFETDRNYKVFKMFTGENESCRS